MSRFFITGVNAAQIVGALAGFKNAEGTISVSFGRQSDETEFPGVQQYQDIMKQVRTGHPDRTASASPATPSLRQWCEVLIQAGPDLTRTNFLNAAESICKYEGQGTHRAHQHVPHRPRLERGGGLREG